MENIDLDNVFEQSDMVFNGFLYEQRENPSQSPQPNPPPKPRVVWPPPNSPVFPPEKKPTPPPISPVFHPENRTKFPFPPKPPIILKTSPPKTPTTPLVLETQELIPKFPPTFSPESDIDPTQCLIPDSQPPSPPPSETQELFELELSSR